MSKLSRARRSRCNTALPQECRHPYLTKTLSSTRPSLRGPRKRRCLSMKTACRHLRHKLLVQARPLQQQRRHRPGTPSRVAPRRRKRQTNRALHQKSAEKTLWQLRGSDTSPESERRPGREQRFACLYLAALGLCAQIVYCRASHLGRASPWSPATYFGWRTRLQSNRQTSDRVKT